MWPALIAAGASLLGGVMKNQASADQSFEANALQDYWMRHRHQIEAQDLYKAGLNPILSVSRGAPSIPTAHQAPMEDVVTPAVSSARDAYRTMSEVDRIRQETARLAEQTKVDAEHAKQEAFRTRVESWMSSIKPAPLYGGAMFPSMLEAERFHLGEKGMSDSLRSEVERQHAVQNLIIRRVEAAIADRFGMATAKEVLAEIVAKTRRHESGSQLDRATAWLHGEQARQERVEAGISETPGVRWIERGVDVGRGLGTGFRQFRGFRR